MKCNRITQKKVLFTLKVSRVCFTKCLHFSWELKQHLKKILIKTWVHSNTLSKFGKEFYQAGYYKCKSRQWFWSSHPITMDLVAWQSDTEHGGRVCRRYSDVTPSLKTADDPLFRFLLYDLFARTYTYMMCNNSDSPIFRITHYTDPIKQIMQP